MQNLLRIILRQIFLCHRKLRPMTQKRPALNLFHIYGYSILVSEG